MPSTTKTKKKEPSRRTSPRTRSLKSLAEPPAPDSGPRRAIFIDVENTSGEEAILAALEQLGFDKVTPSTELVAVGNWRVIGAHVARMLAKKGAKLVHTAPAAGVKDWSDLSIAVAAGTWLGRARPGDTLEIVSADRAFDAVGDAAAALGVNYRRVAYALPGRGAEEVENAYRRTRRGGRRRRRPPHEPLRPERAPAAPREGIGPPAPVAGAPAPAPTSSAAPSAPPAGPEMPPTPLAGERPAKDIHAAPAEEIVATVARLTAKNPERGVNLDILINALKAEGYGRPPGSPRLVTRLRMMKDIEVSPTGMVRLVPGAVVPGTATPSAEGRNAAEENPHPPRPRRRGGRRRRAHSAAAGAPEASPEPRDASAA